MTVYEKRITVETKLGVPRRSEKSEKILIKSKKDLTSGKKCVYNI